MAKTPAHLALEKAINDVTEQIINKLHTQLLNFSNACASLLTTYEAKLTALTSSLPTAPIPLPEQTLSPEGFKSFSKDIKQGEIGSRNSSNQGPIFKDKNPFDEPSSYYTEGEQAVESALKIEGTPAVQGEIVGTFVQEKTVVKATQEEMEEEISMSDDLKGQLWLDAPLCDQLYLYHYPNSSASYTQLRIPLSEDVPTENTLKRKREGSAKWKGKEKVIDIFGEKESESKKKKGETSTCFYKFL